MEQPPACVVIQGVIRPAFIEEHSTIRKHPPADQTNNTEISKFIENKGDNIGAVNGYVHNSGSSRDNASQQVENNGNSDNSFDETSFYRLEMVKIQVLSAHGHPVSTLTCMCLFLVVYRQVLRSKNSYNCSCTLLIFTDTGV